MKRTWIVYVGEGIGHEMHNEIDSADFFGPYTKAEAKRLETELNAVFDMDEDDEHQIATSMPLDHLSVAQVLRRYKVVPLEDQ